MVSVKPGLVRYSRGADGHYEIMSPILAQIPQGVSNTEHLAGRVFSSVAARALQEGSSYGGSHRWAFLFIVVRGWLSAEILDQPSYWATEADIVFRAVTPGHFPLELADIDDYYVGGVPGRDTVLWRYAAASALLDYMVAREGQTVLPRLLVGLSAHGSWTSLIEGMFAMSEEEFTAGWNAYLAEEYGFGSAGGSKGDVTQ